MATSDVVLVLGIHRSGTNAVAGTLAKLSGLPQQHSTSGVRGTVDGPSNFQRLEELNDAILDSAGSTSVDWRKFNPAWVNSAPARHKKDQAKQLLSEIFQESSFHIFNDFRMARILKFWIDVFKEMKMSAHFIIPIFSPQEVVRSLRADGDDAESASVALGQLLWLRHVLEAEVHTRSAARSIFLWNDFQSDWRSICEKAGLEAGLAWSRMSDRTATEIDRFLAADALYSRDLDPVLTTHSEIHVWTARVHEAMRELSHNPLSNSALATLDDIRNMLDTAGSIFGRLLADYEVDFETSRGQIDSLVDEVNGLHGRKVKILAEKTAEIDDLSAQIAAARRDFEEVAQSKRAVEQSLMTEQTAHERTTAELRLRSADADERGAALTATLQERDALRDALATVEAKFQAQERILAERTVAMADVSAQFAAALQAREEAEQRMQALEQSLMAERKAHCETATELRTRTKSAERDLEVYHRYLESSWAERDVLDRANVNLENELRFARDTLTRKLEELGAAEAAHEQLDRERGELSARCEHLSARLSATEASAEQRIAEVKASNAAARAEAEHANGEIVRSLRAGMVRAEAALAQTTASRKHLVDRLYPPHARRRVVKSLLLSGLFDVESYKSQFPEAFSDMPHSGSRLAQAAVRHYIEQGYRCGGFPNRMFDSQWYLDNYDDVRHSGMNPLFHYIRYGWNEGRNPGPRFSTTYYLEANPDVVADGCNPLFHYMQYGRHEGRRPMPQQT